MACQWYVFLKSSLCYYPAGFSIVQLCMYARVYVCVYVCNNFAALLLCIVYVQIVELWFK